MKKFKLDKEYLGIDDGRTEYSRFYNIVNEDVMYTWLSNAQIIELLRKCETNSNKVARWRTNTFFESGNSWSPSGRSIEKLEELMETAPSPLGDICRLYQF